MPALLRDRLVPFTKHMVESEQRMGPYGGTSQKGPNNEGIVLCWGFGSLRHHEEQHRIGWPMFEAKYGINRAETRRCALGALPGIKRR